MQQQAIELEQSDQLHIDQQQAHQAATRRTCSVAGLPDTPSAMTAVARRGLGTILGVGSSRANPFARSTVRSTAALVGAGSGGRSRVRPAESCNSPPSPAPSTVYAVADPVEELGPGPESEKG